MKTLTDLKLEYKQETGLEPVVTAYGFRPYLTWLEEKLLQPIEPQEPNMATLGGGVSDGWGKGALNEPQEERIPDAGRTITTQDHPDLDQAKDDYYNNRNKLLERQ